MPEKQSALRKQPGRRLSTAEFVLRSQAVHGIDTYTYERTHYVGALLKVTITCPKHGDFEQAPDDHVRHGVGCAGCAGNRRHTADTFRDAAVCWHGPVYSYEKVVYVNNTTPVVITCPKHGDFRQSPHQHLTRTTGCLACGSGHRGPPRVTEQEFLTRARAVHGDGTYVYDQMDYVMSSAKITIVCPTHGPFEQIPGNHMAGSGCRQCSSSLGERAVRRALEAAGVVFVAQWQHPTLRYKLPLSIDFAVPACRALIEFDGEFHFRAVRFPGQSAKDARDDLARTQLRDALKNDWAAENGWRMVRLTDVAAVEQDLRAAGVIQ